MILFWSYKGSQSLRMCLLRIVLFPPGAFIGCCPNRCSSEPPLLVGDVVVLRGPSGSSKSLGLLLKEGEVQPGFLALQTLGHTVRDRVFPEAVGKEMDL